jgi:ATP-dependent RNA helicase DDX54/DBP10
LKIYLNNLFDMPVAKRKRTPLSEGLDTESLSSCAARSSAEVDISSALVAKRQKVDVRAAEDEELAKFIQSSIAKRFVKEGTQVLKNSKGKSKATKGEIGGGSFQSMGVLQFCWLFHLSFMKIH